MDKNSIENIKHKARVGEIWIFQNNPDFLVLVLEESNGQRGPKVFKLGSDLYQEKIFRASIEEVGYLWEKIC